MNQINPKSFNTEGPCISRLSYMLPALERLSDVNDLIAKEKYFILQAPRQSGKTTCIQALTDEINDKGQYYALYYSLETLRSVHDPIQAGLSFVDSFGQNLERSNEPSLNTLKVDPAGLGQSIIVSQTITKVCKKLDKPLVLFFDEADSLPEEFIVPFLSQLRDGYINREKAPFPISIALIGMRPIRDYTHAVRGETQSLGSASPFNVVRPLTLSNFTLDEVKKLYTQHTEATGQVFEHEAFERAWYWSEGQPWLVNALAQYAVEKSLKNDNSSPVKPHHIDTAAEELIIGRSTHIDSLMARLREPRIEMVMTPVFTGGLSRKETTEDDTQLCLDLGLVTIKENDGLYPSNPIYAEVMVRYLTRNFQRELPKDLINRWIDGKSIDMNGLLADFQKFWLENSDIWAERFEFKEAGPHFALQGFLQRVLNGGATINRDYALGRTRVDLCIAYQDKLYLVEIKIKDHTTKSKAIEQLTGYMDKAGVKEGWLVIFGNNPKMSWEKKISWESRDLENGYKIHLVGC